MTTPTAATVLLRKGSKVLGSSRREDPDDWGLPGGKLEPGEDPRVGAARELLEETGLRVKPEDLIEVFQRTDGKSDEWYAVTYEAKTWEGEPTRQPGEGLVDWVDWETIERGCFGVYNAALHRRLEMPAGYLNGGWMMGRSVEEIEAIRAEAEKTDREMGDVAYDQDRGKDLKYVPVKTIEKTHPLYGIDTEPMTASDDFELVRKP